MKDGRKFRARRAITWLPVLLAAMLLVPGLAGSAAAAAAEQVWTLTTDYSTFGGLQSIATGQPWTVSPSLATVPGDAIARHHEGLLYVVGRGGSNSIQIYDPADSFALVREFSLGEGLNPQDVAFAPDGTAYVSCYDAAVLLKVDMQAGAVVGSFSTAAYADADGLPETGWMLAVGERLYINCQLLDRDGWYSPTGPGLVLVFDTATDTWLDPIALTLANPYSQLRLYQPQGQAQPLLAVACAGYWAMLDGGVELVDMEAGTSAGVLVDESDLGADVLHIEFKDDTTLFALTSTPSFTTNLVSVRLADGTVNVLDVGAGFNHADLAWDGGFQLFVADRTTGAAGVRVFDVDSGAELTATPLATALPPFFLVLPKADDVADAPVLPAAGLSMGAPFPNPCNPRARVQLEGRPGGSVQVDVFDLRGRRVQTGAVRCDDEGRAGFTFSGVDAKGHALAAGVYRVVGRDGNRWAARSVTLVK